MFEEANILDTVVTISLFKGIREWIQCKDTKYRSFVEKTLTTRLELVKRNA